MRTVLRLIQAAGLVALAVIALAACGSGDPIPANAVAVIGGRPVPKATLAHWMKTLTGGDFYEITSTTAPAGLVSYPPNYGPCIADLRAIAFAPDAVHGPLSTGDLAAKCRELYEGIQEQAMNYLVDASWVLGQSAEQGMKVSEAQVKEGLKQFVSESLKTEPLQEYLVVRHWTLADELLVERLDLLEAKLQIEGKNKLMKSGGVKAVEAYEQKWVANTDCRAGYVVEDCKQFKRPVKPNANAPAVVMEEIGRWDPATSHGFTGQPVHSPGA